VNAYDLYTFYIEATDLKGQAHKVKVERVEVRDVFNPGTKKPEKKIVLHLAGKKKVLSLNKTRTGQMITITGTPEIEQWVGAEIMIEAGKQSGKDTIIITRAPATQSPSRPGPVNQPARADGQSRLDELKAKAQTDVITAYSEIWKAAGLDNQTAQAILKEYTGDFKAAFDKIAEQYAFVIT
jgi:hypothetical protein